MTELDIDPIITALNAETPAEAAWTAEPVDVTEYASRLPICMVYLGEEISEPTSYDNFVAQSVRFQINVITIAKRSALSGIRDKVFQVLLGYQQSTEFDGMEHVSGGVMPGGGIQGEIIWWQDLFEARSHRQQSGGA